MSNKTKYRIFVIFLFVFLLGLGVVMGLSISYDGNITDDYVGKEEKNDDKEITKTNDITSEPVSTKKYDIELVYLDEYSLCGETIKKESVVYDTTLEDLKITEENKQQENNENYDISEETNERLVYKRVINGNCPNHFLVKFEDEKIIVYNVIDNNTKNVYQEIDVSNELVRGELLEELSNGVYVDSLQELNFLIEDIES